MQEECASDITTASSFSVNEAVSTNAAPDTAQQHVKATLNTNSEQLLYSDKEQHTPSQQHRVDSDNVAAIRVLSVTHNHDSNLDKEVTAAHTDAPAIIIPPTTTSIVAQSGHHTSSHSSSSPSRRSLSSEDVYHHDESRRSVKETSVEPRVEMSATPPPPRSSPAQTACYEDTLRSSNSSSSNERVVENDYVSEVQEDYGVGQRGRRYIPLVSPAIASSPEATPNTASGSPHRPTTTTTSKEEHEGCTRALLPNSNDEQEQKSSSSSNSSNTSVYATPHEPTARVLSAEGDDNTLVISQHSVPSLSYEQRTEQLCETEDVMRAVVEYDEHEARQLSMQLHQCTVAALETAQSIALQESTLRICIEAEARLAGQQLRQRAGEDEVARLRELVRQRALLIESERHVRRDGVEGEEVKERAELLNLFRVGLAAWLRQSEVRRKRALMQLGAAAESCVFAEMRARAEAAVEESKERALLYEEWVNAEAALLEKEKQRQQQSLTEEETKDKVESVAEKTVLEAEPDDVSEITAIDETNEVLHDAAMPVASASVSDKGSRKSSHEEAIEEARVHESALQSSQVSKEEEEEQAEDVEYFEWNPTHNSSVPTPPHTTNTNTSTNSNTTMKDVLGGVKMNGQSHESHSPSPSVAQAIPQQTQTSTHEEGEEEESHSHDVATHDTSTSVEIDERRSRSATVRVTPAKALLTSMSQALRSAGDERSARKAEALLASATERAEENARHHNKEKDNTEHKEEKEENEDEVCSSTTSTSMAPDEDNMEEEEDDMVGEVVEVVPHTPVRGNMKYSVNSSARATMAHVVTRHTVPCSLRAAPADSYHAFLNKYGGGNNVERPPPTMRRCRSTTSSSSSRARNASTSREREEHRYCHEDNNEATRSSSALRTRRKVLRTISVDKSDDMAGKEERVLLPPRPYRTRIVYADTNDNDTIRDDCVPQAYSSAATTLLERVTNDIKSNRYSVKPMASPRSEPHYLQPTKAWAVQEREKEIVRALRFCSQHTSPCATPTRTHSARRQHDSAMHSRNTSNTREGRTQHRSNALYTNTTVANKTRPLLSDDTTCVDAQSAQAADGVAVADFGRCYDCDEDGEEEVNGNATCDALHSCNNSGVISSLSRDTVQRKCAPRRRLTTLIPRRDMTGRAVPYSYVNVFLRRYSPESAGRRCVAVGAVKGTHANYDALVTAPLNQTPLQQQQQLNKEINLNNTNSACGALVPRCEPTDTVALHDLDVVSNTTADSTSASLAEMPDVEKESIHCGEADKLVEEDEGECAIASQSSEADELSETDYVPVRRTTTDSFKRSVEQPHRQRPQPSPLRRHTQSHKTITTTTTIKEYRSGNGVDAAASGSSYAARHGRRCNATPNTLSARQYEGSSSFARSLPHTPSRLLRFTPT